MDAKGIVGKIKAYITFAWNLLPRLVSGEMLRFLFFLLLATLIWFLHTTQSEVQTTISYPIHYKELPSNITVSNQLPSSLQVTVQDKGSRLYGYYFKRKKHTLNIDLMNLKQPDGICRISTKNFEPYFYSKYKPVSQILRIQPDSLVVFFVENESKQVPIRLQSDLQLAGGHTLTGEVELHPATVAVSAPKAILDTLKSVSTKVLRLKNLGDTTVCKLELQAMDGVRYSQEQIEVMIPVEAFTECSFDISLQALNFPADYKLKAFPAKVNASFLVRESLYGQMKAEDFALGVDYSDILAAPEGLVEVKVQACPKDISRLNIKPPKVECLIEKR